MALHVVPQTDIRPHVIEGVECPCDPDVGYLNPETGLPWNGNGPLVVHHCFEIPSTEKIGWDVIED